MNNDSSQPTFIAYHLYGKLWVRLLWEYKGDKRWAFHLEGRPLWQGRKTHIRRVWANEMTKCLSLLLERAAWRMGNPRKSSRRKCFWDGAKGWGRCLPCPKRRKISLWGSGRGHTDDAAVAQAEGPEWRSNTGRAFLHSGRKWCPLGRLKRSLLSLRSFCEMEAVSPSQPYSVIFFPLYFIISNIFLSA